MTAQPEALHGRFKAFNKFQTLINDMHAYKTRHIIAKMGCNELKRCLVLSVISHLKLSALSILLQQTGHINASVFLSKEIW